MNPTEETITKHEQKIAADRSTADILTTDHADRLTNLIETAITPNAHEYGFSIARQDPSSSLLTSDTARSLRPREISIHAPLQILANNGYPVPEEEQSTPSLEPLFTEYADLITVHTHPPNNGDSVGLSHTDLTDAIPGPDSLTTKTIPMEIYRAKAVIIFTDDPNRLPTPDIQTPKQESTDGDHPQPWLHLVERTPAATSMDKQDAIDLHYKTLQQPTGETPTEKFEHVRNILDPYIEELCIPLENNDA